MNTPTSSRSIQDLLDWLENRGLLTRRHQAEAFILSQSNLTHLPISIQVLLAVGAFISCAFVIGFLSITEIINFNNTASLLGTGVFFIIVALSIYAFTKHTTLLLRTFLIQSAFTLMIVGKALFVASFFHFGIEHFPVSTGNTFITPPRLVSLALLITTLATYVHFPIALERGLGCFFLLLSIMLNIIFLKKHHDIFLFIYYLLLLSSTLFLLIWSKKTSAWSPIVYAGAFMLLLFGCYLGMVDRYLNLMHRLSASHQTIIPLTAFNIATGIALVATAVKLLKDNQASFNLPFMLACMAILVLSFVSNAGILLAIGFLFIGYGKHDDILTILGAIGLGLFLIIFYYNLPLGFIAKAQTLALSGLVLLSAHFLIKYKKWDLDSL